MNRRLVLAPSIKPSIKAVGPGGRLGATGSNQEGEGALSTLFGFGAYVPERVVTNRDWEKRLDTSDEWITQRTGIKKRRFAAPGETTLTMSANASRAAIADAGMSPADIDEIIVATDTPEAKTPDTAAYLQDELGCREVPGYDLGGSGCAGFIQALDVARARIAFHSKNVLVVGVELITRLIDLTDRNTAVLFGDGAGALVMGPAGRGGKARMVEGLSGTDGSLTGILHVLAGGTRRPFNRELLESGEHLRLVMNGPEVFRNAVARMSATVKELLRRMGKTAADVDLVIPHQANSRIIDAVGKNLGLGRDHVYVNIREYGNTGSASVPLALCEAHANGRIKRGDLVVLTAFGAGLHWAGAALQF